MNQCKLPPKNQRRDALKRFGKETQKKESLKIRGRMEKNETVWFGLGMFGVVGWSVTIPTLIGVALGIWIDKSWPSQFSWTLMLLIGGLILGCMNAWYWVQKGGIIK
ncbi:MAG TPA: ATPase F0F1 [Deltaproteobacteria bacterium]|nr:ATPase F0F1 [Deltaproteobacteria bacterium]